MMYDKLMWVMSFTETADGNAVFPFIPFTTLF